jgi:hypothetical protein
MHDMVWVQIKEYYLRTRELSDDWFFADVTRSMQIVEQFIEQEYGLVVTDGSNESRRRTEKGHLEYSYNIKDERLFAMFLLRWA